MPRTTEEVRAKLAEHFPKDKLEWKNGFAYVPWDDAMRIANDIFGFENVDVELLQHGHLEAVPAPSGEVTYGYSAVVRVHATIVDENGEVVETFRDGQGFNELEFSQEKTGVRRDGSEYRIPPKALIDAAIKGAASGGILRALVLFGDIFGLYLYNDALRPAAPEGQQQQKNGQWNGGSGRTSGGNGGGSTGTRGLGPRPSEKQMEYLEKAGITAEAVETMQFADWKKALDDYFASTPKRGKATATAATPRRAATAVAEDDDVDDLPF